jgi:hypothetical protein
MVPDATLHGTAGVIVLHSKSNKRSQSSIVFWYCALNLKNSPKGVPQIHTFTSIPTAKRTSWQCKTKQVRLKRPWLNLDYSQNWILQFYTNNVSFIDGYGSIAFLLVSYIKTRSRTFISRKGMSRLHFGIQVQELHRAPEVPIGGLQGIHGILQRTHGYNCAQLNQQQTPKNNN